MRDNEILAEVRRGNRLLVVETTTWQGEPRLDVRWWVWIEDEWRPTRAGVSLTPEEVRQVLGALTFAWDGVFVEREGDSEELLEHLLAGLAGDEEA